MSFLDLENKAILITGATSGIGLATAELLSGLGCKLFLTGRNLTALNDLKARLNNVEIIQADLSDEEGIEKIIEKVECLDGFVNSAGIIKPLPVKFIQTKHLDEVFNINVRAAILLTAGLLKKKKINQGGSLVFLSSISAEFPYNGGGLYVSSKAAIESFSKTVALEHANKKIRSNVLAPGLVRTPIFEETAKATSSEELEKYESHYPLGFGEPEDVANSIAFFVSHRSKWITGITVKMDGGLTLGSKK